LENSRSALTRAGVALAGIAIAALLHYVTSPSLVLWHYVFQRLYYLPIIYAALYFGWRGGLVAAALAAVSYIPHIFTAWHHMPDYAMNQYAEIIVFFLVGSVTGVLADVGRRQRRELEAATNQLRDSFEQVKRADRLSAIGQLSASLAHEIRNPLASIDGAANLIESPQTPEDMRRSSLAIVHKEIGRLNRLLTSLLDFARPRCPELQSVDAGTLIDAIVNLAGHSAQQKGITLRKDTPHPLPAIECDPEQIKQVLLNLTINAVQSMEGPGEVVISARQDGSAVEIGVKDEGCGVSEEDLEKIFNPFFTTKDTGTGLGLSVAYQIVAQHGGAMRAECNAGRGMTFSLTLPLHARKTR
jgi:signal transduction histidine kinase